MINFIISSNYNNEKSIKEEISSYMMNYDIEVKYHLLNNNLKDDKEIIKSINGFKVYLLTVESLNDNNLQLTNYIRNIEEDWNSIIIFILKDKTIKNDLLSKRIYLLDIIYQDALFNKILKEDLNKVIKNYDNREKCLTIETNRIIKKIDFKNIEMITKEKDSKKCIIKSNYGNFYTPESLKSVITRLDDRFIKTSRSCIINKDKVTEYNPNENKITLNNGIVSFDISRENKKLLSKSIIKSK